MIVGVESLVRNGTDPSHPIIVIVGATGAVVSIVREKGVVGLALPDVSVLMTV